MNDAQLGIDTGNLMWADGVRNLATITEATDYAEGVRGATVAQFEKRGGTLVAEERYATEVIDFRTQLTKLLSANPDGLHLAAQGEASGGTIVKQIRELGYDGPIYTRSRAGRLDGFGGRRRGRDRHEGDHHEPRSLPIPRPRTC